MLGVIRVCWVGWRGALLYYGRLTLTIQTQRHLKYLSSEIRACSKTGLNLKILLSERLKEKNREMQKQNCITGPGSILLSILLAIVGIGKPEMYLFEKFSCFRFFVKVLYFELYIFVRRMTCGNFCGFSRCAFTLFDQVHFKVDKMNLILLNPVVDSVSFSVNSFFDISSFEMKQSLCQKILVSLFIKNSSKTLDEIL